MDAVHIHINLAIRLTDRYPVSFHVYHYLLLAPFLGGMFGYKRLVKRKSTRSGFRGTIIVFDMGGEQEAIIKYLSMQSALVPSMVNQ